MSNWMCCTTCKLVVHLNATGICLGCQGGFSGPQEEDKYIPDAKMRQPESDAKMRQEELKKEKRS